MKELNEAIKLIEKGIFRRIEFDFEVEGEKYKAKVYRVTDEVIRMDINKKERG